ncbi:MAG TPA: hydroxyacylglutathione hydrolase [Kofleriaceae bacterium]|nr:hydroxyacylglutathione hydrolase [Kofleriaceae bacterium]
MVAMARIVYGEGMRVVPVPCLKDNYAYLVIEEASGVAAIVDPGEVEPIVRAVRAAGVRLAAIWATHHHPDHVGGLRGVTEAFPGVEAIGHASDRERIAGLTRLVDDGDTVDLGRLRARIIHNPGHTLGAISYVVTDGGDGGDGGDAGGAIFTGDTLFGAGCGRVFEGTPRMMHASLSRLAAEAPDLAVYFGHEYTVANLRFAALVTPGDPAVAARAAEAAACRADGRPTTPSTIALERATNPFLRAGVPAVVAAARARDASAAEDDPAAIFGVLRRWKDTV